MNYIDFKAAFDSINRDFIWKAFFHYGLPSKYIRIIQAFFRGTTSAVMIDGELSRWFPVNSGTGQGDIQGPPIFNVCLNFVVQLAEQKKVIGKGFILHKSMSPDDSDIAVMDTDYADDMATMDNTVQGLQETTDLLCKYSSLSGLKVNVKKTKTMAISKSDGQRPYSEKHTVDVAIEGVVVEQVNHFTYLGSDMSSDGTIDHELTVRIQKASGAFRSLGSVWNNRNIQVSTKVRIYRAAVLTILVYGSEVWNTTKKQLKRIEVFHQYCLRKILKIRWFQHVKNEEVLVQAGTGNVETLISSNRLRWFGHIARMSDSRLPKKLLDWKPNYGKRSRGRPRKSWISCVMDDATNILGDQHLSIEHLKELAQDRKQWKRITTNQRDTIGAGHAD